MTHRILHSEELSLANRLVKEIEASAGFSTTGARQTENGKTGAARFYDNRNNSSYLKVVIPTIGALAGIAARGTVPSGLRGTAPGKLAERLSTEVFGHSTTRLDECDLASACAEALLWLETSSSEPPPWQAIFEGLVEVIGRFYSRGQAERQVLSDPLLPGWMHQVLARRTQTGSAFELELKRRTQWFTPGWVSSFLVEECITGPDDVFLDPAQGAGHILVPALERLFELHANQGRRSADVLNKILEGRLSGLDIDPAMTALSTLSVYMKCRDLVPDEALCAPGLFFIDPYRQEDLLGSLWLGGGQKKKLMLGRFGNNGRRVPLKSLPSGFTALATNPPFLSHRNMPGFMAEFLREHYPHSRYDLYAAFIELAMRLLSPGGTASMICQQSFLSIQRYHELRTKLFDGMDIQSIVQLGAGTFAAKQGEKANNAIITLRRSLVRQSTPPAIMSARILSRAEKEQAEKHGIRTLLRAQDNSAGRLFASTSRAPLALWCPDEIASLFSRHPMMESACTGIVLTNGLFTCNNALFVRHHSEVPADKRSDYVPYDKGGGHKWFRSTPLLLQWIDNGENIRQYRKERGQSRALPGESYYFKQGLTYSYIGTRGFKARLLSPGSIFDIASSAVFSTKYDLLYVLGFLNSALARFMLGVLNPTINFQIGDLRRLPFLLPDSELESRIASLSRSCVELATEYDACPGVHPDRLYAMNSQERKHQESIDTLIFDAYKVSSAARQQINSDPWVSRSLAAVFQPVPRRLAKRRL